MKYLNNKRVSEFHLYKSIRQALFMSKVNKNLDSGETYLHSKTLIKNKLMYNI